MKAPLLCVPGVLVLQMLLVASALAQSQTLLTLPEQQAFAALCAGSTTTMQTQSSKLLLVDSSGAVSALQSQLPDVLRALGSSEAGLVGCVGQATQQAGTCNFNVFFNNVPRIRRDYRVQLHPLRAGAVVPDSLLVSGQEPPACTAAGTLTTGQTAILGALPDSAALRAALVAVAMDDSDEDQDGFHNLEESLLGADPADATSPGPRLQVSLNGSQAQTQMAGEPLEVMLALNAAQHYLKAADYYLHIDYFPDATPIDGAPAQTLAYIHPGQLLPSTGREVAISAPALRFDNLPVLTLQDLEPGAYVVRFEVSIEGGVELAASATVMVAEGRWHFSDVTAAAGLTYSHGYADIKPWPGRDLEVLAGGGVAAGDYDNDGWTDLYVTRGTVGPNLLFRNLGNGSFAEVGASAGAAFTGWYAGALFADLTGDGWQDLIVTGFNGTQLKLLRNEGNGSFTDVTTAAGFPAMKQSIGASAADYDRDGDIDLWINHWLDTNNNGYLWRNNGDGTFTDVSQAAGIPSLLTADFTTNFADIDNDGWPDLLVAADYKTSQVFLNNHNGSFRLVTDTRVITDENGMGAAVGDFDNDGDLDWFVSSVHDFAGPSTPERRVTWGASGNRFYQNTLHGTSPNTGSVGFRDITSATGTRIGSWGWGACFADFNNDAWLDLFHVNGYTAGGHNLVGQFVQDYSKLFIADGQGNFSEQAFDLDLVDDRQGRGIVCFDYDHDGDVDLFIANNEQPPRLYRNDGGNRNHWLQVRVAGEGANTQAIGARVYVTTGGVTQLRELQAGSNFMSQNPVAALFGLGGVDTVDNLRVIWPSGASRTFSGLAADRMLFIEYPATP